MDSGRDLKGTTDSWLRSPVVWSGRGIPGSVVVNCGLLESEKLGFQPSTRHRTVVVFTTIDAVDI